MAGRDPLVLRVRCERARQWASLRLDGELSALEAQLLERHLDACEPCRAFDADVRSATALLRGAPVEVPLRRFEPPRRRLSGSLERRRTALVAAAALALGALAGSFLERPAPPAPQAPGPEVSLLSNDVRQLRDLPRPDRQAPERVPSTPPNPPEGVI